MFHMLTYICDACSAAGHAPWSCWSAHWAAFSPWSSQVGRCWSFTQHGGSHWHPYVKLWGITLSEPYYQFTVVLRVNTLNTWCIGSSHLTTNSNMFISKWVLSNHKLGISRSQIVGLNFHLCGYQLRSMWSSGGWSTMMLPLQRDILDLQTAPSSANSIRGVCKWAVLGVPKWRHVRNTVIVKGVFDTRAPSIWKEPSYLEPIFHVSWIWLELGPMHAAIPKTNTYTIGINSFNLYFFICADGSPTPWA